MTTSAHEVADPRGTGRVLATMWPATIMALILLWIATLAGCDGERDRPPGDPSAIERRADEAPATKRELLARVSAAIHATDRFDTLAYTDLVAVRRQLRLPQDAAFPGPGKRRLLFSFASRPLFAFGMRYGRNPRLGVLGEVLDSGQIEAAASTNPALALPLGADQVYFHDVIVVRTGQPFAEIASRLRSAGYEEAADGLLLGGERPNGRVLAVVHDLRKFPLRAVGDAGRGVVVFGGSARAARAALGGADAQLTPAAELLARLPGASRAAKGRFGAPCVLAFGLGEDAAPREGELRASLDHAGQPERLLVGDVIEERGEVRFSQPTAKGRRASVHFRSTNRGTTTLLTAGAAEFPYDCP